jgi:multicomponent Na+:H+ antiporter subunit G
MMAAAIDLASWVLLVAGGFFCVAGGVGLVRMPDFYTRMHAASVTDSLGAGLILAGLLLQAGFTLVAAKLVIVGLLIFFASPTAAHALAKAGMTRGIEPLVGPREPAPSKR